MNSLKKMSLVSLMVLGLASLGCGDDNKNDNNKNDAGGQADAGGGANDAGGGGGDAGGGGGGAKCKAMGTYDGFTAADIQAKVKTQGACITEKQVNEICAIDPAQQAGTAGSTCFIGGKTGAALRTCTIEGDDASGLKGIRDVAPDLSEACLNCYADSVACAAENCAAQCAGMPGAQACLDCRETNKCTSTFYTCSGLPTTDELK